MYADGFWRHSLQEAKDVRLGRCNEGFNSIRTLQMLSWGAHYRERIMQARRTELRIANNRLWMQKVVAGISYVLATVVGLVTLGYYVMVYKDEMKASVILPVIALIASLIGPLSQFPTWIQQCLVWRSAYDRVNSYCDIDVHPKKKSAGPHSRTGFSGDEDRNGDGQAASASSSQSVAEFSDCSLAWPGSALTKAKAVASSEDTEVPLLTEEPTQLLCLTDITVSVKAREMLVIVGKEGQGKTSALQGILGELVVVDGSVHSPATKRRQREHATQLTLPDETKQVLKIVQCEVDVGAEGVAYSAQQSELFSGTVRDNIVFGQKYSLEVYSEVLVACALDVDLATMPAGDHTEITQGGGTLSGGQRARIGIARAVYAANICLQENPRAVPLVLLDDPLASVDRSVANHISDRLFGQSGLLMRCAIVVTSADPWWLAQLQMGLPCKLAIVREGRIAGYGGWSELRGLEEIQNASPADDQGTSLADSGPIGPPDNPQDEIPHNDQDSDEDQTARPWSPRGQSGEPPSKQPDSVVVTLEPRVKDKYAQTEEVELLMDKGRLVEEEHREVGFVKWTTYNYYLRSVGYLAVTLIFWAIVAIMIFQQCTTLWLSYWVEEHKDTHFLHPYLSVWPAPQHQMGFLQIYAILVFFFVIFNFTGHFLEVIGGVGAARAIFRDALVGTFAKPIQWWDVNPTGRVLNRFSEDVETMDLAITNILGVILGAVLYFVGHVTFLALANPYSLILLPFIIIAFEFISKYYRTTIRELHRMWLVGMSTIYQEMVEAICCRVTIRAFDRTVGAICGNIAGLDHLQRLMFTKEAVKCWISLRLQLVGFTLTIFNTIYPILQYFGIVGAQSAALVGFSIQYSSAVNAIIQQLIFNFSDLEMQLVSIERLREYSLIEQQRIAKDQPALRNGHRGIKLENICVTYRDGLKPALTDVSLDFSPKEIIALVGRTGAGKSSLLLSILQLVHYEGKMWLDGTLLADCDGDVIRKTKIGIVPQSPVLFAGDVNLNLDPENSASEDEKFDVLRKVGLQAAILASSAGLATKLATDSEGIGREGLQLSQGQRQLLCAARVLLRKPRVVLLDEVTSCLAPEIGAEILTTLIGEFSALNATVILITHKDDQRKFCNRVVTIDAGRIKSDRRIAEEEP
eukprot:gnl/MRDRNA2_/MRDRNA2_34582_c0_seq1.p1 gnl/MRDRNA2_/MRDRNA2_34582_c0~~gnl/MRDRNA2_/MRDRNA2_34582_c0_seq1.p1  ORF type:complete len:1184 (-),score=198.39 gnl/MRDRNA2_/MRDRNA2_34582_c0_seq1:23-3457(-)